MAAIAANYIAHSGDDALVVNAARVSFAKSVEIIGPDDERLIRYLAQNNHWTPFAHPQITLRCSAPIPIRTQAFKHKAGFVENEESRRYIRTTPEVFMPAWRAAPTGGIKQGSSGPHPHASTWGKEYARVTRAAVASYILMIEDGVAPEQARFVLPQGVMVNWIWTASLAAYARFYRQRVDSHAQREVGDLARAIGQIICPLFPVCWAALVGEVGA